ncbi:MAG TPA: M28 family peptidase [Gemmatimonadales bacterium]|nr:M28 family peptidase [Gemmatimonadales bacterium]
MMVRHTALPVAALLALLTSSGAAQGRRGGTIASEPDLHAAAALITPDKALQRLSVIADDSMGGRNTPSRGLELTAQYLAANYRRWGLKPLGDSGTWFQRYTVQRLRPALNTSGMDVVEHGSRAHYTFGTWAIVSGPMTGKTIGGPVTIVAGAVTPGDIAPLDLHGAVVLFVSNGARAATNPLVTRALVAKAPLAIITLDNGDAESFKARVANALHDGGARPAVKGVPLSGVLQIVAHDSLFGHDAVTLHHDFNSLRNADTPVIQPAVAGLTISLVATAEVVSSATAPNVVAVMESDDPVYRNEYVIFSAHMDHIGTAGDGVGGCTPKGADSICNGADDDGSGTTGVLSIAEAVAALKGHTRRSVIFLNVSGEEKGLLGSAWFVNHPTVPLDLVVADINMDMISRNNPDSIVVIGKEHSDMGATLARVQSAHPELHLVAADDIWPEQGFYARSDHFNFARKGVPVLFFFNGIHAQYHQADDEVRLSDTSKLARVATLGFYLGMDIATTTQRPKWNPQSYQTIVVDQLPPPITVKKHP